MDLRLTFNKILQQWGHDIYLQRIDTNAFYSGSDNGQPIYSDRLERYTVRETYPGTSNLIGTPQEEIVGIIHDADIVFYFQWDANPHEGDRIYENIERYPNNQVVWKISLALPMRGVGGRVEYWVCGTKREEPN